MKKGITEMRLRVRGGKEMRRPTNLSDRREGIGEIVERCALLEPPEHLHLLRVEHPFGNVGGELPPYRRRCAAPGCSRRDGGNMLEALS